MVPLVVSPPLCPRSHTPQCIQFTLPWSAGTQTAWRGTPLPPGEETAQAPWESLSDADLAFLLRWRGESGAGTAAKARELVGAVWRASTAEVFVYRCVARLSFLTPRVVHHPALAALRAVCARPGGLVADVGCAYGQESRALVLEAGLDPTRLLAVDVDGRYWAYGRQLFGRSPQHGDLDQFVARLSSCAKAGIPQARSIPACEPVGFHAALSLLISMASPP